MLIALDIETVCNVENCKGFGDYKKCDHALHHLRNRITVVGCYWEVNDKEKSAVFRNLEDFEIFCNDLPADVRFVCHNGTFDIKSLRSKFDKKFADWLKDKYQEDTLCMAVASSVKVSKDYLEEYEEKRKYINKKYKMKHRKAGGYSLKMLAPFFIQVNPFWEVDDKDSDEYVIKDCKYTYRLYKYFEEFLKVDNTYEFYKERLMNWNKLLLDMEESGIKLDFNKMNEYKSQVEAEYETKSKELLEMWKEGIDTYNNIEKNKLIEECKEKIDTAVSKMRSTKAWEKLNSQKRSEKFDKTVGKILERLDKRLQEFEGFNIASPSQLLWLLKDYYGYRCVDDNGKESVGKDVKEKLIEEGKEDIILFDEVGKLGKLLTSFFPSYEEMAVDSIIYGNFNIGGTRTGRLSSSKPNIQQIPAKLKECFVPRPGYKFISRDISALEPNIIAYLSEDMTLCNIFLNGHDFHGEATRSMLEYVTCHSTEVKKKYPKERNMIKQVDLSLFYGTGANGLVRTAKKHRFNFSKTEAQQKLNAYKDRFKQVFKFKDELDSVLIDGSVRNLMGRKIAFDDPEEIYMKGFNSLIQGSGSDLVIEATYRVHKDLVEKGIGKALLLEHDAVIFEVEENYAEYADKLFVDTVSSFKLKTIHGTLTLGSEGGIYDYWWH